MPAPGRTRKGAMRPRIALIHDYRRYGFPRERLSRIAVRMYRDYGIPAEKSLNVILCSDYRIRRLNNRFRGIDRATDVLAFPFDEPDLLGEVYISLQRCRIQGPRWGLTYEQEIVRVFVHGLFHLLGYDHRTDAQRSAMEQQERSYCCLRKVG